MQSVAKGKLEDAGSRNAGLVSLLPFGRMELSMTPSAMPQ